MRFTKLLIVLILTFACFTHPTFADVAGGGPVADKGLFIHPVQNGDGYQVNSTDGTKNSTWKHDGTDAIFDSSSGGISFDLATSPQWIIDASGDLVPATDSADTIGLDAARPSNIFTDSIDIGASAASTTITSTGEDKLTISGVLYGADGTAALPAYSFTSDPNTGISGDGSDGLFFSTGGVGQWTVDVSGDLIPVADSADDIGADATRPAIIYVDQLDIGATTASAILVAGGENILQLKNGTAGQELQIFNSDDGAGNTEYFSFKWTADEIIASSIATGTGTVRDLHFNGFQIIFEADGSDQWFMDSAEFYPAVDNVELFGLDNRRPFQIYTGNLDLKSGHLTAGSGTGLTVNEKGLVQSVVYKVTLTFAGLSAAATNAKHTIATLPAGMKMVGMIANTTIAYAGTGITDADIIVGIDSGVEDAFMKTHDVDGGTIIVGDVRTTDLGAELDGATVDALDFIDFSGTTVISVRIDTVGANTDQLTAGSTTYSIETVKMN